MFRFRYGLLNVFEVYERKKVHIFLQKIPNKLLQRRFKKTFFLKSWSINLFYTYLNFFWWQCYLQNIGCIQILYILIRIRKNKGNRIRKTGFNNNIFKMFNSFVSEFSTWLSVTCCDWTSQLIYSIYSENPSAVLFT